MKRSFLRELAALLYPSRCPVCGEVIGANDSFCHECSGKLVPYNDDFSVAGSSGFTAAEDTSVAVASLMSGPFFPEGKNTVVGFNKMQIAFSFKLFSGDS